MEQQVCKVCGIAKNLTKDNFELGNNKRKGQDNFYWYKTCKDCDRPRILAKIQRYKNKNRKILAKKQKEYHLNNKENNSNTKKIWYQNNKDLVKRKVKLWIYNKRKDDVLFNLKSKISGAVWKFLKKNGHSKNNKSILKFLPYTLQDLKNHIEAQFEPWMTWENYGTYRADIWKDHDKTTWTWQLDHIIPHSKFNYSSMEDKEFKECWSLKNLRPLSSKQNLLDGNRR